LPVLGSPLEVYVIIPVTGKLRMEFTECPLFASGSGSTLTSNSFTPRSRWSSEIPRLFGLKVVVVRVTVLIAASLTDPDAGT
jgi:hypothetical protein